MIEKFYIRRLLQDDNIIALISFCLQIGEDDRCLHVALPVIAFLEILTKPVTSRATTATHD